MQNVCFSWEDFKQPLLCSVFYIHSQEQAAPALQLLLEEGGGSGGDRRGWCPPGLPASQAPSLCLFYIHFPFKWCS